jgi:multiple sugar transport system substrate-binding protein
MPRSLRTPRRKLAISAVAALGILAVTGCSSAAPAEEADDDTPVTITFQWWGNDERAAFTEQAIDLFEAAHPNVTVKTSFSTIDSYIPKLATQLAGGGAPDLFLIPMESVREYASKGVLAPIDDYVGDVLRTDDIDDSTVQIGTVDGTLYGMTLGIANNAMIYNPTVWEAAGATLPGEGFTWDDLDEAGQKIRDSSGGATAALSDPGGAIAWFEAYLKQNGKAVFTEDGEIGFTEKDLVKWWTLTGDLVESGAVTDAETTSTIDQSMQNSGLARGLSAAEFAAGSLAGAYVDTVGAENIAIAPFPTDTDSSGMYMVGTNVAAVSEKSENKRAAVQLLDFILNDEEAGTTLGLSRGLPPNTATYAAISPSLEGGNKLVSDFVTEYGPSFVETTPLAPAGASVLPAEFTLAYEQVSYDQVSIADAAKALVATFKSAIA